ncbi:MAG TPA: SAM-dependent methyltransferase [Stellaceae bacterium]|nr:SAM-dependent methyltransferase [Stellaceae bacterium]
MSGDLLDALRARIRSDGPLTLAQYMAAALWDPRHGYYAIRDPLGASGDFITAPEISQVFGELIGLWFADTWRNIGAPDPVILCELGPGRGTLMADLLRAARGVPEFRRALRVHLVEASAPLRAAQAKALADFDPTWHANVAELPPGPLLLVANEFLDALPIRQFERSADGWHERRIGLDAEDALAFAVDDAPARDALPDWPVGSIAEDCPAARELAQAIGARLARDGGAALFVDYGYFPRAPGDSFQAVAAHRRHDPLRDPGNADLTAHVDFQSFAAAATAAGARAWGPAAQGAWLQSLGVAARLATLGAGKDAATVESLAAGVRRLIEPAQMGTLFKALALTSPAAPPPAGFARER